MYLDDSTDKSLLAIPNNPEAETVIFCICSNNFLGMSQTLASSIQNFHPESKFVTVIADKVASNINYDKLTGDFLPCEKLGIKQLNRMKKEYSITEFNTSLKAAAFLKIFETYNCKNILYLDPDMFVISPLEEVLTAFKTGYDAILTPHVLVPDSKREISDLELIRFGTYNLGFLGLQKTREVIRTLEWWHTKLVNQCIIDLPNGLFVDQKWAEFIPSFVSQPYILKHPGYNVAYWNLSEREISKSKAGNFLCNREELRLVHFSGVNIGKNKIFSRHSHRFDLDSIGVLKELYDIYRKAVKDNGHDDYKKMPYAYSWNGTSKKNLHAISSDIYSKEDSAVSSSPAPRSHIQNRLKQLNARFVSVTKEKGLLFSLRKVLSFIKYSLYRKFGSRAPQENNRLNNQVLVVDWSIPRVNEDAGSNSTLFLLKSLILAGKNVTFFPSDLDNDVERIRVLNLMGVKIITKPQIETLRKYLKFNGKSFQMVILSREPIASYHYDDVKSNCPDAKLIFNTVDLHYLRETRRSEFESSAETDKFLEDQKNRELALIEKMDITLLYSPSEIELVSREIDPNKLALLPLVYQKGISTFTKDFHKRKDIAFLGGYRHLPNIDAVKYFVSEIFPGIRAQTKAKFLIVGSNATEELKCLADASLGIEFVGYVENIEEFLSDIRVFVSPLRYGAGIKGKLLTSAAAGTPIVASEISVEGMGFTDEENVILAKGPSEFISKAVNLYEDESLWYKIRDNATAFVESNWTEDIGIGKVHDLLEKNDLLKNRISLNQFEEHDQYLKHSKEWDRIQKERNIEKALVPANGQPFQTSGQCTFDLTSTSFTTSLMYSVTSYDDGLEEPNWREHLQCNSCKLTNRIRFVHFLMRNYLHSKPSDHIYISEHFTVFRELLSKHFINLQSSEFWGEGFQGGEIVNDVRNENIESLSFSSGIFDLLLSFDVLEHVADYSAALDEFARVLNDDGSLLLTAPMNLDEYEHTIRCYHGEDGELVHLMEPEYHGNPVDSEHGALCYRYFGWKIVDELKEAGFRDVKIVKGWSKDFGFLGRNIMAVLANK